MFASNPWKTLVVSAALGLLTASACGGSTSDGAAGSSGSGAAGSTGGSASGGSTGSAGSGASGGSTGGSGAAGASAGAAGSSGTAGASGGSGGSAGLPNEWRACSDASQCTTREAQCCQLCGPDSANQAVAFNRAFLSEVEQKLCAGHPGNCPVADCVLRPGFIVPLCLEGLCTAIDIRMDKLTSCSTSEQCRLRWGTGCCEYCGDSREMLVAVNSQVDYEATLCGSGHGGCPPCAPPPYPNDAIARCSTEHRCEVAWIPY
jgi:hypothetical protein